MARPKKNTADILSPSDLFQKEMMIKPLRRPLGQKNTVTVSFSPDDYAELREFAQQFGFLHVTNLVRYALKAFVHAHKER